MNPWLAFFVVTVVAVTTTGAALALVRSGTWTERSARIAAGLAAGMMLWLSCVELAPSVLAQVGLGRGVASIGAGVVAAWILNRDDMRSATSVSSGLAAAMAIAVHDLPEGLAFGVVLVGGGLRAAVPIAVGMAAHNLLEKVAVVGLVRDAPRRTTLGATVLLTAPEPIGAASVLAFGVDVETTSVVLALGFAAGVMFTLSALVLPQIALRGLRRRTDFGGAAVLGVGAMLLLQVLTG